MTNADPNTTFHRKLIQLSSDPSGFAASEPSGYPPEQVRRAAEGLVAAGHIVRFKVSPRRIRYFLTVGLAKAYMSGRASASTSRRSSPGSREKAPWGPDEPLRITPRTKFYIAPPLPRNVFRTYTYPQF